MLKKTGIISRNVALIFLACIILGFTLNFLSELLPKDIMKKNVAETVSVIQTDKTEVLPGEVSTFYNKWSDAAMMLRAIYDDNDMSSLELSVMTPYTLDASGENWPPQALEDYLSGKKLQMVENSRYWQGYLIFLRPLLLFLNYNSIRIVLFCVELILMMATITEMTKRKLSWYYYIAFIATIIAMGPLGIFINIHSAPVFCITMISVYTILKWHDKFAEKKLYPYVFLIIGICTSYFDLLSYPLITWGISSIFLLILDREWGFKEKFIKRVIIPGLSWILGYAGFWVSKWLVGSLLVGKNLLKEAYQIAEVRTSLYSPSGTSYTSWGVIEKNLSVYFNKAYYIIGIVIVLIFVSSLIKRGRRNRLILSNIIPFVLIAITPFVWLFAMPNHSYVNFWMTFRILSIAVFALTAMLAVLTDTAELAHDKNLKTRTALAVAVPLFLLAGFCVFLFLTAMSAG